MGINLTGETNINLTEAELARECYHVIRRYCRDFQRTSSDAELGCFVRGVVELQTALYGNHLVKENKTDEEGEILIWESE